MPAKAAGSNNWPPPASNDRSEAEPDRDDQDHREQGAGVVIDVEASRDHNHANGVQHSASC
jgi:hypothetical protein